MDANTLAPGRYLLMKEVAVPRPDRRVKHDWRRLATVPALSTFLVEERKEDGWTSLSLRPEGGRTYSDKLYLSALNRAPDEDYEGHGELLRALIPHLQPTSWDVYSYLDFNFCREWYSPLLDRLVKSGKITLSDVAEAAQQEQDS